MLFAVWYRKKKKKDYIVHSKGHLYSRQSVLRKVIPVWGLFSSCTDSTATNFWF